MFGDTQITRPYIAYKSKRNADKIIPLLKKIWDNKNIVIIEGEKSRLGVGNSLFNNALTIRRVLCPSTNAFNSLDKIKMKVKDICNKDDLILMALGPTATILASDFVNMGLRAIDLGHLDIEYEWYLQGSRTHELVEGKYTNEAINGNIVDECKDEEYLNQIVLRIDC